MWQSRWEYLQRGRMWLRRWGELLQRADNKAPCQHSPRNELEELLRGFGGCCTIVCMFNLFNSQSDIFVREKWYCALFTFLLWSFKMRQTIWRSDKDHANNWGGTSWLGGKGKTYSWVSTRCPTKTVFAILEMILRPLFILFSWYWQWNMHKTISFFCISRTLES